ncbi:MAG: hypothetical protein KDA92_14455, partial [Planctomycetales bacterium]|nr:hypothetical protein [Planctomycetales bacterium]
LCLSVALIGVCDHTTNRVNAQDDFAAQDDPFADGGDEFAADDVVADDGFGAAAGDPFAAGADVDVQAAAPSVADDEVVPPTALVDAIRVLNPQSPEQLFRAVDQLIRAEQAEAARPYLAQLMQAELSDVALAELHHRFGTAAMLRLARTATLAPEGAELSRKIMTAVKSIGNDPARLEAWASQLSSDDRRTQVLAARNLLRARGDAVEPVVRMMAEDLAAPAAKLGAELLQHLESEAVQPLLAIMDSSDAPLRAAALIGLGRSGAPRLAPYLVAPLLASRDDEIESRAAADAWRRLLPQQPLPQQTAATQLLNDAAARAYAGNVAGEVDSDNQMSRWVWDAKAEHAIEVSMSVADAASLEAARLYEALIRLQVGDATARERATVARLQVDQVAAGLDMPLADETLAQYEQLDAFTLARLLDVALQDEQEAAAIALLQLIGQTHDSAIAMHRGFESTGNRPAPLVRSLSHPNRRVRFAAAAAIHELNPPESFDGASRYADVLGYFAAATGQPHVLTAHPNSEYARELAGHFSAHGYKPHVVSNERDLLEQAASSPDIELILLSDSMNRWSVWTLIEMLRANPKSARIPVVVLARKDHMAQVEQLVSEQPRAMAWVENLRDEDLASILPRIAKLWGRDAVDTQRRLDQAETALGWLKQRAGTDVTASTAVLRQEEHLIAALKNPALTPDAIEVLAGVGSPAAQIALLDFASQETRPLALRQAAAAAFHASYRSFGRLLTREQVVQQYARYNRSRNSDAATQALLGEILDTIEGSHPKD